MIGTTGSGKTTFAHALAQQLGMQHIELDALFWQPGWVMSSAEELWPKVAVALQIVWLDLPLRTTFPRVLGRTLRRLRTREVIWGTNRESFRNAFLSRDSILLFSLRAHRRFRRSREQLLADYPHVRLRSTREVERYVA